MASTSAATTPAACKLVKAAEYKQVLGRSVRLSPGVGSYSCNVLSAGAPARNIIPYSTSYNPTKFAYMMRIMRKHGGVVTQLSLSPIAYVVVMPGGGGVVSYAVKNRWLIGFEGTDDGAMTKAQAIKLIRIAFKRV